jgi:hypothetical protein
MHRIVESIEDNEPWFFYFFYSNDESEASRRLERFTAVESQPSCKVGGPDVSVCFYHIGRLVRHGNPNDRKKERRLFCEEMLRTHTTYG